MLDNKVYDLMMQIVQESKSLHHIKTQYCKDTETDSACSKLWDELMEDKEEHINKMVELLKSYL